MNRDRDSRIVRRGTRRTDTRRPAFLVDVKSAGMVQAVHRHEEHRAGVEALATRGNEAAVKAIRFLDGESE